MKSAVLATFLTGAAAFAPSSRTTSSSSALKMSYENELGVIAPTQFFGTFDPLDELCFAQADEL
jgi:hypothetical protein